MKPLSVCLPNKIPGSRGIRSVSWIRISHRTGRLWPCRWIQKQVRTGISECDGQRGRRTFKLQWISELLHRQIY